MPSPGDSASLAKAAFTVSPLPLCAFSTSTISAGTAPLITTTHRMLHTGLQSYCVVTVQSAFSGKHMGRIARKMALDERSGFQHA
jgi:hypothetical protein